MTKILLALLTFTSIPAFAGAGAEILTCQDEKGTVSVVIANAADGDYAKTAGFEKADHNFRGEGVTSSLLIDDQHGTVSAVSVDKNGKMIQVLASGLKILPPSGLAEECTVTYPNAMAFSSGENGSVLKPNLTCKLEIM